MGLVNGIVRATEYVATATTAAAGAAAGGTVGAVAGAARGGVRGAGAGLVAGARSEPAAVAGLAALGAAGVVEWPILIAVGSGALALRQLRRAQIPLPVRERSTAGNAAPSATGSAIPSRPARPTTSRPSTVARQKPAGPTSAG